MSTSQSLKLPVFAPEAAKLADVRSPEMLPFALYNLAGLSTTEIWKLAKELDKDSVIGIEPRAASSWASTAAKDIARYSEQAY